jgi:spore germination protein KC
MACKGWIRTGLVGVSLALLMLPLSGCWNRRELNDLAITVAAGIDKAQDGYLVSVQVIDPTQVGKNKVVERTTTTTYQAEGRSVFEALRKITKKCPRKIYISHMRMLVLSEAVAKDGITKPLDLFLRDHESRSNFNVIIAKSQRALDILSTFSLLELIPATELYKTLKTSEMAWAPTVSIEAVDLIRLMGTDGMDPVLTGVSIAGNKEMAQSLDNGRKMEPGGFLEYKSIAVFKHNKLLGWLDENDGKSYNYVTNHVKNTVGKNMCPKEDGVFATEVFRAHSDIIPLMKDGQPAIKVETWVEANLGEVECELDLSKASTIKELEGIVEKQGKELIEGGIRHVQENFGADIYGFGAALHRKYPKQWAEWREHWEELFRKLPVEVKVTVKIRRIGKSNIVQSELGV